MPGGCVGLCNGNAASHLRAFLAVQAKTNQVEDSLLKTYSATDDLKWYREHLAGDQFVIVSWNGVGWAMILMERKKIHGSSDLQTT